MRRVLGPQSATTALIGRAQHVIALQVLRLVHEQIDRAGTRVTWLTGQRGIDLRLRHVTARVVQPLNGAEQLRAGVAQCHVVVEAAVRGVERRVLKIAAVSVKPVACGTYGRTERGQVRQVHRARQLRVELRLRGRGECEGGEGDIG